MADAALTPNVVVQNPTIRRVAQWIIGVAALVLPVLEILDTRTGLDFSEWLPAATAITLFIAGAFGLAVVAPNIPANYPKPGDAEEIDTLEEASVEDEVVDMSEFEEAPKHAKV